ncbi:sirohydrochlorin chelatase [Bacillus sp. V33-4]|nr:sirohydrochlorin chelatase [Bacillus sp. V33-4]PLR85277.1 hypothetical protein CVD23_10030 [Bacillus sp. V33-4]
MEAVILIGHGSRSEKGNMKFRRFIDEWYKVVEVPIKAYGFLENGEPDIFQAVEGCVEKGAKQLIIVPFLLLPGIHANEDIPSELKTVQQVFPDVTIQYGKPIGYDEEVVKVIQERLGAKGFSNSKQESVLLVCHGSREPEAAKELSRLAEMLQFNLASPVYTGYIKSDPDYRVVMDGINMNKVYVVPHFLFTGGVAKQISERLAGEQSILCDPTGFDGRLRNVLRKRVAETRASHAIFGRRGVDYERRVLSGEP